MRIFTLRQLRIKSFNKTPYSERHKCANKIQWKKQNKLDYNDNLNIRIDSIMDDYFMVEDKKVKKPRMWVTFDNYQIYPKYLITYERVKDKPKQN